MRDLGIEFISVFGLPPVDFPMDDVTIEHWPVR
jgi:hypothetical protein